MKQHLLKVIFLTILLVSSILSIHAQTLYEKELPQKRFPADIEKQAQDGNVVAMYELAYWYRWGQANYPTDYAKAMELCLKASEFGYPFAQDLIGNMHVTGSGVERNEDNAREWYSKAFENLKVYADRGDVKAMDMLAEYYGGYKDECFTDDTKALYWNLRALECGGTTATGVAFAFVYAKGVEKDENFALAWYARSCIDYESRGWLTPEYLEYKELSKKGYLKNEWQALAEPTYISIPRVASNDADSIQQVMLLTVDILNTKAEEFRIQQQRLAAQRSNAGKTIQASTTNQPKPQIQQPAQNTTQHTTSQKRGWLSTLGKVVQAAAGIASGNTAIATNALSGVSSTRLAELQQLFSYSGSVRRGQTDYSGRVISDELTAPSVMGQAHYVFYTDGYCNATSANTCVHCYGKGTCYMCNGTGRYWHAYLKTNQPCPICGGRGVCQNCQGIGYQVSTKLWAPGEAEAYLNITREMKSSSSNTSSQNTASQTTSCPDCGGKGYRPESYQYAAQSSFAPYHNTAGNTCPICNGTTDHYHYRCTTCKRK